MKKITVADVLELPASERIKLVEDIWDSIAAHPESVELSDGEKKIIDVRLEAYHKNPNAGSPWKDVCRKILSKR